MIAFARRGAGRPGWRPASTRSHAGAACWPSRGVPADPARLDLRARTCRAAGRGSDGASIPGAASAARRWPAERWAAVARAERARRAAGRRHRLAAERPLAERGRPRRAGRTPAVLAGRTDLRALAATVAGAARVLCGDTGVAHLATAFGMPSVLLFGPTPPSEWGPAGAAPPRRPVCGGRRRSPRDAARSRPAGDHRGRRPCRDERRFSPARLG